VRFIAVTQDLDTDRQNPTSRFLLLVLGAAPDFERSLIQERSYPGLMRYRRDFEAGRVRNTVHSRSGRDLPPHGAKKIFNRKEAVTFRRRSLPLRVIAKRLSLGLGTVTRTLMERSNTQQIACEARFRPSLAQAPTVCKERLASEAELRASV
jgi:DNA invertase Pin-like site-specific DNA recombinase